MRSLAEVCRARIVTSKIADGCLNEQWSKHEVKPRISFVTACQNVFVAGTKGSLADFEGVTMGKIQCNGSRIAAVEICCIEHDWFVGAYELMTQCRLKVVPAEAAVTNSSSGVLR
ncbi:hypothetical protein BGZ89_006542 [Linnemannia elongata]|nr:hypothetical protein BGZ89_006542 [Linnemannia elongata]